MIWKIDYYQTVVSFRDRLSVRGGLKKYFGGAEWSVVKFSADRPNRDGSRRPVATVTDGVDSRPFVSSRES